LVEEAERSAQGEEEQKEGEETEIDKVKDKDEIIADDADKAIDKTEAEEDTTTKGISEPEALSSI
jgi:hypothetical protein